MTLADHPQREWIIPLYFLTLFKLLSVENVYHDNEFRPFVPNFLTLESGVGHDNNAEHDDGGLVNTDKTAVAAENVEMVENAKESGDDAYKASHRTIDDGHDQRWLRALKL